jgi:hypothetical protein
MKQKAFQQESAFVLVASTILGGESFGAEGEHVDLVRDGVAV